MPAGPVVVEVFGVDGPRGLRFDGRAVPVAYDGAQRRATFSVDLKRDTGFHELIVGGAQAVFFATEDAKLRIDGVREMLDYLGAAGLAWSGTMFFSDTTAVLRDARLDRSWLERVVPELVGIASAIVARPATARVARRRRALHGVPDLGATLRLLRARPTLLEQHPDGPLRFGGAQWAPREIVVRERHRILDTPGNRRAALLLESVTRLCDVTLAAMPPHVRPALQQLRAELVPCVQLEPFRSLLRVARASGLSERPVGEERTDERYQRTFSLWQELHEARHWDPRRNVLPERAYAGHADQIFQRFCGLVLAHELALTPTERTGGPQFASAEWELYLDVSPATLLTDWRAATDRPTELRPDVLLHHKPSSRLALLDAKYRNAGARASSSSLSDVQLYLQAYQRERIAILFPPESAKLGDWQVHEVSDGRFSIFEVPFRPHPELGTWVTGSVLSVVDKLLA